MSTTTIAAISATTAAAATRHSGPGGLIVFLAIASPLVAILKFVQDLFYEYGNNYDSKHPWLSPVIDFGLFWIIYGLSAFILASACKDAGITLTQLLTL